MLASGGYTDTAFPWQRRRIVPISSTMIATEALDPALVSALLPAGIPLIDTRRVLRLVRPSPDGRHILFGGRARFTPVGAEESVRILHRQMSEIFPQLASVRVVNAWAGLMAFTFDFLPKLGVRDDIWYALACNGGSGIVMMSWLGRVAAWKILERPDADSAFEHLEFQQRPFYNGTPWFIPLMGSWYGLRDWIDIKLAGRQASGHSTR